MEPPQLSLLQSSHDESKDYEIPPPVAPTSFTALKERIKHHYEICSDYYYSLWGEHIHHGYFTSPTDTKEVAQTQLIDLLLERSKLVVGSNLLDVGCGVGGTSRYLASRVGCKVLGVTISGKQVKMARDLTANEAGAGEGSKGPSDFVKLGDGAVRYLELDAEKLGIYSSSGLESATFDCVWISEALSHLPEKELFFRNASDLLNGNGKLVIADWFKAEDLTETQMAADIKPIEDGMLLPKLFEQSDYVHFAEKAGLSIFSKPLDISKEVSKTWDISWSLIQSPALWAFAFSQGRDGIAFLQAFRAMRRGYANETFRYAVMVFQKT